MNADILFYPSGPRRPGGFDEFPPTREEVEDWRELSMGTRYGAVDRADYAAFADKLEAWIASSSSNVEVK
jgi:hypothetical protein